MSLHVVLGKGPVGSSLTDRLVSSGHTVRVLSRTGGSDPRDAVEHVALDAGDPAALRSAATGGVALYNCANPPYHRWSTEWPPVAAALLEAAQATGAVLVVTSNLYGYGEVDRPMTEDLPLASTGTKGRIRAGMYERALSRHRAGDLRMVEVRASDFVGPRVTDGGHLGSRAVPRLLAGRSVSFLGDPDVPHSWTSVADVAAALELVAGDERAWGRAWHVPTAPPVTFRDAVGGLCAAAGVERVKVTRIPHLALRAVGLVSPMVRELEETRHQFVRPFVLDSTAFTDAFGLAPTPLATTWADTVAWWRARTPAQVG
jgi:nucleoside-diphosphate-sugar epimerase